MAGLAVILTSGEVMERNLSRALEEDDPKPWAFNDWKRQMQALKPTTSVAFLDLVDQHGSQVLRFTPSSAQLSARRAVLATIAKTVDQVEVPFFDGYPYEFRFEGILDSLFQPLLSLDELAEWLNQHIDGLTLEPSQLQTLVTHAKSNKVGVFVDGAPRKADYFPARGRPVRPSGTPPVTDTESEETSTASGISKATNLEVAIGRFSSCVKDAGLVFLETNEDLPKAFLAALIAKRFAILSGLSGSGKTLLARALGQWLGKDEQGRTRYLVEPVRPDWTSPEPLLGYEDALLPPIDGRRAWTVPRPRQFICRAMSDPAHLYLLVLDEMNLAHVERYFADVLSGIESDEAILPHLFANKEGEWSVHADQPEQPFPNNLLVIGTVNIDETTYQFSPKVLDRAFTFDFRVATKELGTVLRRPSLVRAGADEDRRAVHDALTDENWHLAHPAPLATEVETELIALHERLSTIGFEFGHRTFFEAIRFTAVLAAAGIATIEEQLDWTIMTKVLPRLHGSRRQLESFLSALLESARGADAEKPTMPRTTRKVERMLDLLRANQFVSFAE
jgi:5-methylcytosine-specific restriction protein B